MNDKITLLSLRPSSARTELWIVRRWLRKAFPDIEVESFLGNLDVSEKNERQRLVHEGVSAMEADSLWFGMDGMLPDELAANPNQTNRYLLFHPYSTIWEDNWNTKTMRKFANGYTHMLVPSSWWYKYLDRVAPGSGIEMIADVKTPFLEAMEDPAFAAGRRAKLDSEFPVLKGKKILYVYITGKRVNLKENNYTETDMKDLLETLPENYVLATNSMNLRYSCRKLPASMRSRFLYVSEETARENFITCADAVISNYSYACSIFASLGKPFGMLSYCNNSFEQYMKINYSEAVITGEAALRETILAMAAEQYRSPVVAELILDGKTSWAKSVFPEEEVRK